MSQNAHATHLRKAGLVLTARLPTSHPACPFSSHLKSYLLTPHPVLTHHISSALPQSFWSRLSGKYGNKFYWQEKGEASAILNAVSAIDTCLREEPGRFKCSQVREWAVCLACPYAGDDDDDDGGASSAVFLDLLMLPCVPPGPGRARGGALLWELWQDVRFVIMPKKAFLKPGDFFLVQNRACVTCNALHLGL